MKNNYSDNKSKNTLINQSLINNTKVKDISLFSL